MLEPGSRLSGGRHVCAFYSARNDLFEFLAPYFAAGVANRESCVWVIPEDISRDQALNSAGGFARRMGLWFSDEYLEVVSFRDWYLEDGHFHPGRVKRAWKHMLGVALSRGHKRLRITGDASWVAHEDWNAFISYEVEINKEFSAEPLVAVCTYALPHTPTLRMNQVLAAHDLGVVKRCGEWSLLSSRG